VSGNDFGQFTRGSFVATQWTCAAGYRWDENMAVASFGEAALRNKICLDNESILAMGDSPMMPYSGRDDGTRDPLVMLSGPWLVAQHGDEASWSGQDSPYKGVATLRPPREELVGHRRFASLTTKRRIRLFANRYGFLGHGYTCVGRIADRPVPRPLRGSTGWLHAEHLAHWEFEIVLMGRCIALLDAINYEKRDQLHQVVEWSRDLKKVTLSFFPFTGSIAYRYMHFETDPNPENMSSYLLPSEWVSGDLFGPARYILTEAISMRLREFVRPCLYPDSRGLYFKIDSLLASLYVSLALEVVGKGKQQALCAREGCDSYFAIEHGRQKYCSTRCSNRAYEQRKRDKSSATV